MALDPDPVCPLEVEVVVVVADEPARESAPDADGDGAPDPESNVKPITTPSAARTTTPVTARRNGVTNRNGAE